jgi:hypothetical protein
MCILADTIQMLAQRAKKAILIEGALRFHARCGMPEREDSATTSMPATA